MHTMGKVGGIRDFQKWGILVMKGGDFEMGV